MLGTVKQIPDDARLKRDHEQRHIWKMQGESKRAHRHRRRKGRMRLRQMIRRIEGGQ